MSALGAFFRGAAGPGMLALADSYERRDAEEAKRAERAAALAAEQAFRAEQAGKERMARYGSDGTEPGMLAARRSSSGGGGESGGGNINQAVADYARENRVSMAQAQADLQSSLTGIPNRTKQTVTNDADLDGRDRRTGTGQTTRTDPDEERMAQVWANAGKAFSEAGSRAKSNYAQLTEGDGNAQRNQMTGGMLSGALTPAQTAEGVAASKGDGAYGKGGVNQFSGKPDAIGASTIRENDAQAGSAGRANRDGGGDALEKLPPAVKVAYAGLQKQADQISGAITKAQADGVWEPEKNKAQSDLMVRLRVTQDKAGELLAPYLPATKSAADDADIRKMLLGGGDKPGAAPGKPAPTQGDARKGEKPAAKPAASSDPLAGLTRQGAREKRAELTAELKKWEGKAGAEARIAEIRTLLDRLDTGAY